MPLGIPSGAILPMNGSGRPGQASWYRTSVASRPPTTSIARA